MMLCRSLARGPPVPHPGWRGGGRRQRVRTALCVTCGRRGGPGLRGSLRLGGGRVVSPSVLRSGGEGCACFLLLFMKGESSFVASIKAEEGDVMLAQ